MSDPCESCGLEPEEHDDTGACPDICHCGNLACESSCCWVAECWWECRASTIAEHAGDRQRDGDAA